MEEEKKPTDFLDVMSDAERMVFIFRVQDLAKTMREEGEDISTLMGHQMMDVLIEDSFKKEPTVVSCKRGCSFCCYIHTDITPGEAKVLRKHMNEEDIPILQEQAKHKMETWAAMDMKHRKCIFLKKGECSVYADRPNVCRKHYVVTPAELCNGEHETVYEPDNTPIGTVSITGAELVTTAMFYEFGCDTMAKQLLKVIEDEKGR